MKRKELKKNGNAPIMALITIEGIAKISGTKLEINPNDWDLKHGRVQGKNAIALNINQKLDNIRGRIDNIYEDMLKHEGFATAQKVKLSFLGVGVMDEAILKGFNDQNIEFKKLVDSSINYYLYLLKGGPGRQNLLDLPFYFTLVFISITPIRNLTLRSNISLFTYEAKVNDFNSALISQTDEIYLVYRAFINASYKIYNSLIAESFFMLNSHKRTFQGTTPSFSMWTLGIKKEIMDKKAIIGLSATDPYTENKKFKSEINTPNYSQKNRMVLPFRSFGVTFSYNFGKTDAKNKTCKQRGIKNEDQKEGESNQGTQMGGGA